MKTNRTKTNKKGRNGSRNGGQLALVRRGEPASRTSVEGLGFPQSMIANLRYCDDFAISITTGSTSLQIMRWNSTFDPDATGIGHQPLYRDTFAGIYNHYAVISAAAEVTFINTSSVPLLVGVCNEDDLSAGTDARLLMEMSRGQHKLLPPLTGSLSTKTFNIDWDCKKILSIDPFSSEEYKTPVGSDPSEGSSLVLWATTIDGSSATAYSNVNMVQHVLWSELATQTIS